MAGIQLRSPSFGDHQPIPARHAKDHANLSPALEWSGVPQEAVELAVLCEDPDAPSGTFTHWVLAGLQPTAPGLADGEHPAGAVEGRNDFGEEGYSGPLPPVGDDPHRYFFRVSPPQRRLAWSPERPPTTCAVPRRARNWPAAPLSVPTSADHSPRRKES
jgi:Raf kinase inhibitor-like YbhB/YbcL family protein